MNKIIKASAGTGKTYRLSLEYLIKLIKGESFNNIFVMTFTRKATFEIKQRILLHLATIISNSKEGQDIVNNLKKIDDTINIDIENLKNIYNEMLKNKDKINIYTIDGFLNMIFKKVISPYINLYNYEIINTEENKEFIERVLKKIVNNKSYFKDFNDFFTENIERDIDEYIKTIDTIILNRWKFLLVNHETKSKLGNINPIIIFEESVKKLDEIFQIKGKGEFFEYFKKDFRFYNGIENLDKKTEYILRNNKKFLKNNFWNGNKIKGANVAGLKEELEDIYEDFKKNLAIEIYNEEVISYEKHIFNIADIIFKLYDEIKIKEKKFTHSDIGNYTYKYLTDENLGVVKNGKFTNYFYELIGNEIDTIFIDEFQDTSILQWNILKLIIESSKSSIVVGDEKQSIYSWRGGEKRLFETMENIIDGNVEVLDKSYRSDSNIINYINDFFGKINDNFKYDPISHYEKNIGGYIETFAGSKIDVKNELVEKIKEKLNGNYKNVAILARGNKDLNEIALILGNNKIPYVTESNLSIVEHRAIKPIYFVLNYFLKNSYIDLLNFLRSDIINVDEKHLKLFIENQNIVEDFINDIENIDINKLDFIDENIMKLLEEIKTLKKIKFREINKELIENFGILNKYKNTSDLKNIYYFFELMKSFDSLKEFMDFLKKKSENEELKQIGIEDTNAIKLMTIHKSKGLEFSTLFFYWKISSKKNHSEELKFFTKFDSQFHNIEKHLFVNSKYKNVIETCGFDFFSNAENIADMEEINNLYVALTRASKNLFIFADFGRVKLGKNFSTIFSEEDTNRYKREGQFRLDKITDDKIILENNNKITTEYNFNKYFKNLKEERLELENNMTLEKEFNRKLGLAIHYYLENITYGTEEEITRATKVTYSKYGNMLGYDKIEIAIERATNFIRKNKKYYDKKYNVFNEYEIEYNNQKHRIDRLLIDEKNKKIYILDYKSGHVIDKAQLDRYKGILEELTKNKYIIETRFLSL